MTVKSSMQKTEITKHFDLLENFHTPSLRWLLFEGWIIVISVSKRAVRMGLLNLSKINIFTAKSRYLNLGKKARD